MCLIIENTTEVVPIRKHLVLAWKKRPAGINQVNTGQVILLGDFLSTQVFFDRQRIIRPTFDRCIVGQ